MFETFQSFLRYGPPLIELNNTAYAAWAQEDTFDRVKEMLCSSSDFYTFLGSTFLLGGLGAPCQVKPSVSTQGCVSGCHNQRRRAPGGRWRGIKRRGREEENARRAHQVEDRVTGKEPGPTGAVGAGRAWGVAERGF